MKNQPVALIAKEAATGSSGLAFGEALESPCATCATSPCCRNVPLHTFEVGDLMALDHARYLLNFDRIELGIAADGTWNVLYQVPCRHLDLESFGCTVHDTDEQPSICVHYNPYSCWYKGALGSMTDENHLRVDRARLDAVTELLEFGDDRRIVNGPEWHEIEALFADLPITEPAITPVSDREPVLDRWIDVVLGRAEVEATPAANAMVDLTSPCTGCDAPCCSTLIFPMAVPSSAAAVDYLRFLTGFPGVEIGVADGGWAIIVRSRCRHLTADNRCGVYGQPERPLLCKYYDEHSCSYRPQFSEPRPEHYLRVRYEHFAPFSECFAFDDDGTVVAMADTATMRDHLESHVRSLADA